MTEDIAFSLILPCGVSFTIPQGPRKILSTKAFKTAQILYPQSVK